MRPNRFERCRRPSLFFTVSTGLMLTGSAALLVGFITAALTACAHQRAPETAAPTVTDAASAQ